MIFRSLLASLALMLAATCSQAGPFRRHAQATYQPTYQSYQPTYQPVYEWSSPTPTTVIPAGAFISSPISEVTSSSESVSRYTPSTGFGISDGDGLEEVNAKRASRGLRPFIRDESLTHAARACAQFRAANRLFGHTSNDFSFLPAGSGASSAGCAAYPASYGWMSCCTYENYTYAGAAWVTGSDGRRYMHLFVR
jgi:uncharacterized protein YkwD